MQSFVSLVKGFGYLTCDRESLDGYKQGSKWLDLIFKKNTGYGVRNELYGENEEVFAMIQTIYDGSLSVDNNGKKGYL